MRKLFLAVAVTLASIGIATAQAPTLAGKNVTMIIGVGTGGGIDLWGRVIARHIGKHLPGNPTIVPQNMPAAGGIVAVNHIYTIAPKDGTVFGIIPAGVSLTPLTGAAGARFDPLKLTWIGTPTIFTDVCIAMARAQVKTFQDLLANQLIVGTVGVGGGPYIYPKALNGLLGTKFKLVSGFPSATNVLLAMERNEIDGVCQSLETILSNRPDWIANGTVNVLFQGGMRPNPQLKGIPFIVDLARTPEEKKAIEFLYAGNGLGRPFIAPPGIPADRVNMLQDAFMATMTDPEFLADAKKQKLDVDPQDGAYLAALINRIYATPKPIVDRVTELIK